MSSNVVQKAEEELTAFIRARPHMNSTELLQSARKEMKPQWKILFDAEKARLGDAFSEHWKRAVLLRLAPPGRFSNGGDRVSQPEHIFLMCPVHNGGASVMKASYSLWKTASRQPLPMTTRKP